MFVRQPRHPRSGGARLAAPLLGGLLLALAVSPPARAAQITYTIKQIFKIGDRVRDIDTEPSANGISLQALNDRGQILFSTFTAKNPDGVAVLRYADDQFTPILVAGREGPLGVWPKDTVGRAPLSMDQEGNVLGALVRWNGDDTAELGTFLWDARTGNATPILVNGTPATEGRTFQGGWWSPVINNRGQIALPGWGHDAPDQPWAGIFLREPNGQMQPIALTGQPMPDGRTLEDLWKPSLNDAGVVAFLGVAVDDDEYSAYLWEKGTIIPVAVLGQDAPEGGEIRDVRAALVNSKNSSVLVLASREAEGKLGLYRFEAGQLTKLVAPGQTLPDGGTFSDIVLRDYGVSSANDLGQHAFIAKREDGSTAAYLLQPDGTLSLILKSGQVTELGKVTLIGTSTRPAGGLIRWGSGIGLNRQGQVALNVRIDNGPTTLVLLTPDAPQSGTGN